MNLSSAEQQFHVGLLERVLNDSRIEEHRTRVPSYREHILQREDVIVSLLGKLAQADTVTPPVSLA